MFLNYREDLIKVTIVLVEFGLNRLEGTTRNVCAGKIRRREILVALLISTVVYFK